MPRLGEFLGALLADAAQARVRADLEAVKIAETYSRDPLLKNLPVPRFRLPDITVEVPLAVSHFEGPGAASGLPFEEPTTKELRDAIRAALRAARVRLSRETSSSVPAETIERTLALLRSGTPRLLRPSVVSDDIAGLLVEVVDSATGGELTVDQAEELRSAMRDTTAALLVTKLRPSLSWQVAVTAEELKAHNHSDSIVRLRLTISEDGYEVVERADGRGYQLTPE